MLVPNKGLTVVLPKGVFVVGMGAESLKTRKPDTESNAKARKSVIPNEIWPFSERFKESPALHLFLERTVFEWSVAGLFCDQ